MHRFFIPSDWIQESLVQFGDPVTHQLLHVLRLNPGDQVIVLDGSPNERVVRLVSLSKGVVEGVVESTQPVLSEPGCRLSLFVSMTQRVKFEWILQKGTELGVSTFIPVITSRSLIRESSAEPRRMERWQGILREAAEQSHRGHIPDIKEIQPFPHALDSNQQDSISLIPWENEKALGLKETLTKAREDSISKINLMIGPEGGFSEEEIHQATTKRWIPVSLGPRILRMETAALAAVTMILYELGEFNPPGGAEAGS